MYVFFSCLKLCHSGEKEYTPPPWHPSFLGLSCPTLTSQSKKSYGVYLIFLGKQGKRVYTRGPERRVYTIEASDPEKEKKEGFHGGGVYFFLPCHWPFFKLFHGLFYTQLTIFGCDLSGWAGLGQISQEIPRTQFCIDSVNT